MAKVTGFNPDWAWPPPGAAIADILEERGWTKADFAKKTGLPHAQVRRLISGEAKVTEPLAGTLARVIGSTKRFWLAREAHYRSDRKERLFQEFQSKTAEQRAELAFKPRGNMIKEVTSTTEMQWVLKKRRHKNMVKLRKTGKTKRPAPQAAHNRSEG